MTVTVKDSMRHQRNEQDSGRSAVTDEAEEPGAPAAPTVVSTDVDDNDAATYESEGDLVSARRRRWTDIVDGYAVEHKKTTETSFVHLSTLATLLATIRHDHRRSRSTRPTRFGCGP